MVSRIAGVLGELLITFAVIIALFVFYQSVRRHRPDVPGRHIVDPNQTEVIAPYGEASMVTFTTCHPQWSNTHRLIVHGVLAGVEQKGAA